MLRFLDFLCIHPSNDGNGRMSRLLTTLLLYRNGFYNCLASRAQSRNSTSELREYAGHDASTKLYDSRHGLTDELGQRLTGGVLGYHIIHSCAPGEVTPEEAHAAGVELAVRLPGDKYEAVVSTHLHSHSSTISLQKRRSERNASFA